jgi:hypothetical protein
MVIRRLVFLGSGHFGLERPDFILNFGHGKVQKKIGKAMAKSGRDDCMVNAIMNALDLDGATGSTIASCHSRRLTSGDLRG